MSVSKVSAWGNSQGVRIPKEILDEAAIKTGNDVMISVVDGKIVIENLSRKKNIRELFEGYNGEIPKGEVDWGKPVGNEIW